MYKHMTKDCRAGEAVNTQTVTISAGEACSAQDSFSCAKASASSSLPHVFIEEQVYVYGFSPEEALQRGTMFPELVN